MVIINKNTRQSIIMLVIDDVMHCTPTKRIFLVSFTTSKVKPGGIYFTITTTTPHREQFFSHRQNKHRPQIRIN